MSRTVLARLAAGILVFTAVVWAPRIAVADCTNTETQHGGAVFLEPLVGDWRFSGTWMHQRFDGHASAVRDNGAVTLEFRSTDRPRYGIATLSLRYEARCDDFVGVRHTWSNDGHLSRSNGRGVARGNGLDVVFPIESNDGRTDVTLQWDSAHESWSLQANHELGPGHWVRDGALRLERAGSATK